MKKLLFTLLLALTGATAALAQADKPPPRPGFAEITWDDLVPADWDPLKQFQGMNLGALGDADPRAQQMLKKMREVWDNAPVNAKMDGRKVRLPGYVVPLEENAAGMTEFLLVPYFGACIHTPPPPANQIVHVLPKAGTKLKSMDVVWVDGTLKAQRSDSGMGVSGYRLDAEAVIPYVEKPAR
ncbi:MAG: DUF3299 domain-containing protein [Piscinibacter sp.]|uniref:DUF3299 domain-containing protein n=1 Tax=Piscinibacter TaxID=1114981 RepID=UPI000FDDFB6C|nr:MULTISPECIES: DUF3299 domain-containing protein [Piscinibacter]MCW5662211.1 DUF3299 domain-containing protein [Piscinibacter sp.]